MPATKIVLPDQTQLEFDHEPTVLEVATRIGPGLAKATLGGRLDGSKEIVDLRSRLKSGTRLEIVTAKSPGGNEVIRHSAAHVLAQAVQELWPDVKVTIGPVIDNGFFYDFDSPRTFQPEDLEKIEKKMTEIIGRDLEIVRSEMPSAEALATFKKLGETYKLELIEGISEPTVGIYKQGEWFDLCRGPHVQRTGQIKAIKVLSLAGAYWRGDEKRQQLQRIYATAFGDKKDLEAHLLALEEAKKRDHRKVGKELGLFIFHQLSPGAPFFTGKGSIVYNELIELVRSEYRKIGFDEVITPQIFDVELFKTSGHYANYADSMYFSEIDDHVSGVKPMNCPAHCLMYAAGRHSYRELPLRMADFGRLHRYERSGAMHGLTRVRSFCQDDGHVFCTPDQLLSEIRAFMELAQRIYDTLGMPNYKVFVATRPEKRMGTDAIWDKAESALTDSLQKLNIPYEISPGEGAFYGPKVEIHFVDAIGRAWQLGTIQVDFNLPEAFNLIYVGDDNAERRPVVLHRAVLGSLERFIGVYIEHTGGRFPTWLSPEQVRIVNIAEKQADYGREVLAALKAAGIRATLDDRNEKLGFRIRQAQLEQIPYMLVVGDAETANRSLSVRLRTGQSLSGVPLADFALRVKNEIAERALVSPYLAQGESQPAAVAGGSAQPAAASKAGAAKQTEKVLSFENKNQEDRN